MYQSIPSLTIPRVTPGDSHVFTAPGVGFSHNFLCLGGWDFELEKFATVLKENAGTSQFISEKPEQFEKQVFLCCLISFFAKTVYVYCIFNNMDHFRSF